MLGLRIAWQGIGEYNEFKSIYQNSQAPAKLHRDMLLSFTSAAMGMKF
jgi:hypothetical protein